MAGPVAVPGSRQEGNRGCFSRNARSIAARKSAKKPNSITGSAKIGARRLDVPRGLSAISATETAPDDVADASRCGRDRRGSGSPMLAPDALGRLDDSAIDGTPSTGGGCPGDQVGITAVGARRRRRHSRLRAFRAGATGQPRSQGLGAAMPAVVLQSPREGVPAWLDPKYPSSSRSALRRCCHIMSPTAA